MTETHGFPSVTRRFGLPYLYAGQARKEFFVNEALSLSDALIGCAVEGEADSPPLSPDEGDLWLVGQAPDGAWSGRDGDLALFSAGSWRFIVPDAGFRAFDRTAGCVRIFNGSWFLPTVPGAPEGGAVIDQQARAQMADLIATLVNAGVLSEF